MLGIVKRHAHDLDYGELDEMKPASGASLERKCLVAPSKHRFPNSIPGRFDQWLVLLAECSYPFSPSGGPLW
jgi:hypothetical protein